MLASTARKQGRMSPSRRGTKGQGSRVVAARSRAYPYTATCWNKSGVGGLVRFRFRFRRGLCVPTHKRRRTHRAVGAVAQQLHRALAPVHVQRRQDVAGLHCCGCWLWWGACTYEWGRRWRIPNTLVGFQMMQPMSSLARARTRRGRHQLVRVPELALERRAHPPRQRPQAWCPPLRQRPAPRPAQPPPLRGQHHRACLHLHLAAPAAAAHERVLHRRRHEQHVLPVAILRLGLGLLLLLLPPHLLLVLLERAPLLLRGVLLPGPAAASKTRGQRQGRGRRGGGRRAGGRGSRRKGGAAAPPAVVHDSVGGLR